MPPFTPNLSEEAFDLFINKERFAIITKWTNQKMKLIRKKFQQRLEFTYDIIVTKLQTFIGVLLFFGYNEKFNKVTFKYLGSSRNRKTFLHCCHE